MSDNVLDDESSTDGTTTTSTGDGGMMNKKHQDGDDESSDDGSKSGPAKRENTKTTTRCDDNDDPSSKEKQSFDLGGLFVGGWQSNEDIPDRRNVVHNICQAMEEMRPDHHSMSDEMMSQKLPFMAERLEEHLYRSAHTKEEYLDMTTLKHRLQMVAHGLELRRDKDSGDNNKHSSNNNNDKKENLPLLQGDKAREVDLAVTESIGRVRILESVAMRIADTIMYHLPHMDASSTFLLFVAGKGNNGANAIAAARILYMRGWKNMELVTLVDPINNDDDDSSLLRPNMKEQLDLYRRWVGEDRIFALDFDKIRQFNNNNNGVIVDGILGTGIDRPVRGVSLDAILAIKESQEGRGGAASPPPRILSIDMPSGLNHITGQVAGGDGHADADAAVVRATWTLNLHMIKSGQIAKGAQEYIGELWSAESALGFTTFGNDDDEQQLLTKFTNLYKDGPIVKIG